MRRAPLHAPNAGVGRMGAVAGMQARGRGLLVVAVALSSSTALAQGATANQFFGFALNPSFVTFKPPPYPRPFAKGSPIPT